MGESSSSKMKSATLAILCVAAAIMSASAVDDDALIEALNDHEFADEQLVQIEAERYGYKRGLSTKDESRKTPDPDPLGTKSKIPAHVATYPAYVKKHDQEATQRIFDKKSRHMKDKELNWFPSKQAKMQRAQKIANDIYKIARKPIVKKVEKTADERAVERIKKGGKRDAKFFHRILKHSMRKDVVEKRHLNLDEVRMAQERKKPKLAYKNKQLAKMYKQDKPLEKDPKELDPRVVQKVIRSGLPKAQKKRGPEKKKKKVHKLAGWEFPLGKPVKKTGAAEMKNSSSMLRSKDRPN